MVYNSVNNYAPNTKPITLEDLTGGVIRLTPGVYTLAYDEINKTYLLNLTNQKFKLPPKIYGKAPSRARHFLEAYKRSINNLGVMLTGEKGTGKSELAHLICNMAIDEGYPVVVVYGVHGDNENTQKLIDFIESLGDVIVLLDEFGKNFPVYLQDRILPLLSSSSNGKKMFVITENNYYSLSQYIRSRPGRARYHIEFNRLEPEVLTEYLEDKQVDKEFAQEVLNFYSKTPRFTFDYLKALVEEHQLFPETPFKDLVKILNIDELKKTYYIVIKDVFKRTDEGKLEPVKYRQLQFLNTAQFKGHSNFQVIIYKDRINEKGEKMGEQILDRIRLTVKDIISVSNNNYLLKKTTANGIYEIKAEEMDEDKKKELLDRSLIPVEDEYASPPPMGFGGEYL